MNKIDINEFIDNLETIMAVLQVSHLDGIYGDFAKLLRDLQVIKEGLKEAKGEGSNKVDIVTYKMVEGYKL